MSTIIDYELAAAMVLIVAILTTGALKGFTLGKVWRITSWVFQHPFRAAAQRYPEDWDVKER